MALAFIIQIDMVDAKNKTSFTRIRVPSSFSIAALTTFAQDAAAAINSISGCRITGATIGLNFDLAGLATTASNAADVASKAFFKLRSAAAGFFAKFSIPTFDEDTFVIAGTDQIDTAATPVAAYLTLLTAGNGVVIPTDKYGNDLVAVDISRELFMRKAG